MDTRTPLLAVVADDLPVPDLQAWRRTHMPEASATRRRVPPDRGLAVCSRLPAGRHALRPAEPRSAGRGREDTDASLPLTQDAASRGVSSRLPARWS